MNAVRLGPSSGAAADALLRQLQERVVAPIARTRVTISTASDRSAFTVFGEVTTRNPVDAVRTAPRIVTPRCR